jgi:hypothetical protein
MSKNSDDEPAYYLRSVRARGISNTITQSLLNNLSLAFLIFGPGKKSEEFYSHRVPIKNLIEKELRQTAKFPEDIDSPSGQHSLGKRLTRNPATNELYLMKQYDYTIILMMSIGSISEYSLYLTKSEVAHKIRLYIQETYRNAQNYLMTGPVKAFNEVYRQVYFFNDLKDLLKKIKKMVEKMLILLALQG